MTKCLELKIGNRFACLTLAVAGDARLLHGLIISGNGLVIGLYQAARWAGPLGYRLPRPAWVGEVRFELRDSHSPLQYRD